MANYINKKQWPMFLGGKSVMKKIFILLFLLSSANVVAKLEVPALAMGLKECTLSHLVIGGELFGNLSCINEESGQMGFHPVESVADYWRLRKAAINDYGYCFVEGEEKSNLALVGTLRKKQVKEICY
jgi:hypothetical protein